MRLAILGSRGIPARHGGFEAFAEELSVRLVASGHDVSVFCPRGPGPQRTEMRGVRLERVRAPRFIHRSKLLHDLFSLWQARERFDVVYMLGYTASPFCLLPRLFGSEVWINMDGLDWRRPKHGFLTRLWLRACEWLAERTSTRLIYDNAAVAREVSLRTASRKPYSVIEYGVELPEAPAQTDVLAAHGLERDGYYLLVARCEPENQLLEVARAFEHGSTSRPLVVVANTEVDTPLARELLARRSAHVRVIGSLYDRVTLAGLRAHCRAHIHGHTVGGTNPTLLEAMASGSLVVAHDNPFNREVLRFDGRYFTDTAQLDARIAELERMSRREIDAIGDRCRERIETHYDWDRITDRYERLMPRGRPARARTRARRAAA